jgi:hypothetical protein
LPWHALAGQLALTAAGLSPTPSRPEDDKVPRGIPEHLAAAGTALDQIVGLDGPSDLALWSWHVAELGKLADQMDRG